MKKKMYNDEDLLRDKMLRHEFQADERAWEQMEGMLDGSMPPSGSVPPPAAAPPAGVSSTLPSAIVWLAGLGLVGLLSLLAVGQISEPAEATKPTLVAMPRTPESAAAPHRTERSAAHIAAADEVNAATETAAQALGSASTAPTFSAKKSPKKSTLGAKNADSPAPTVSDLNPSASANLNATPHTPDPQPATIASPATSTTTASKEAANNPKHLLDNPAAGNTVTAAHSGMDAAMSVSAENGAVAVQFPALTPLPQNDAVLLHVKRSLPLPKAPLPIRPTSRERRFQLGAALGGQWAIVDRSVNKITLLPSYGITLNAKITPRWWAETGLTWRRVSGYNLSATWESSGIGANGLSGKWAVGITTSGLDFLELPLLIKYALRNGDQRFMIGARYAKVYPQLSSTKNYSLSVNSYLPNVDFQPSITEGIRPHDFALTVGAEARISRRLWADIRHSQGLYDLTYDSFFGNTNVDRTAETQLTLRYYFWSF